LDYCPFTAFLNLAITWPHMRKFIIFCLSILAAFPSRGQDGHFYITNHVPQTGTFENTNFQIVQDSKGILYIANNRGIISYDGQNWQFIETPEAVFAIAIDSADQIFIGGQSGFGKLLKIGEKEFEFKSLSDSLVSADNIFQIEELNGRLYFINQKTVFIYSNNTISDVRLTDASVFRNLMPLPSQMLVSTSDGRVLNVDNKLSVFNSGLENPSDIETSFLSPDKSKAIIFVSGKGLYMFDNQVHPLQFDDGGLLSKIESTSGVWLDENLLAIGTLERGVVFLDLNTMKLRETLDYESGLPDNQVFSMTRDKIENSLWVSHSYGFTRVSPFLPFRSFGRFPGLKGKLITALPDSNGVYVGTSVGLFHLEEVDEYRDKVVYVPIEIKTGNIDAEEEAEEKTEEKSRRGLFGFLRRKKDEDTKNAPPQPQKQIKLEKRVIKELRSKHYEYKKIEGVDSKVFNIIDAGNSIIVSGLGGIYEITNDNNTPISVEPFIYSYKLNERDAIVASGADGYMYFFDKTNGSWSSHSTFSEVEDVIHYIFQDKKGDIWLLGSDVAYRCQLDGNRLKNLEFWNIENPFYSANVGSEIDNKIWVMNSLGIFYFDEGSQSFKRSTDFYGFDDSPNRFLAGTNSTLWVNDGHDWMPLGNDALPAKRIKPISLFNDVSFISYDINHNVFWIITNENDLYKMDYKDTLVRNKLPLLLKEIKSGVKELPNENKFEIVQNQNSLTFEFLKPDYDNLFKIEYRYKLDGLGALWSSWSSDNKVVSFPFLPEGNYSLHFECRDVFGQITSVEPYTFTIVPPYWKRAWFYAVEILTFGALFLLSFRLNRLDHNYKWLSRLLAFLTLILTVEFIQVVVEMKFQSSQSPVTSFFIQVFIALILMPVEGVLRKTVFKLEADEQVKALNKGK